MPYYLKFLNLFVVFMGGWFGYEMAGFVFGDNLFSSHWYGGFFVCWFNVVYAFLLALWVLVLGQQRLLILVQTEYFGGQGLY